MPRSGRCGVLPSLRRAMASIGRCARGGRPYARARRVVAAALHAGDLQVEPSKSQLLDTRQEVIRDWTGIQQSLREGGRTELANEVERFAAGMQPPMTDREWMAQALTKGSPNLGRED